MAVDVVRPFGRETGIRPDRSSTRATPGETACATGCDDWRVGLPTLTGTAVSLRELRATDAASLANFVSDAEVLRFLSPPPQTAAGFRRFVRWTHRKRAAGHYACFAIVPRESEHAVGFFQLRGTESGFDTAEWGFVLGRPYWGTGVFAEGAALLLAFAFGRLGVRRLEARAVCLNGRANGALRKLGAVPEGVLRQSFTVDGRHHDTTLWAMLRADWRRLSQQGRGHDRTPSSIFRAAVSRIQ